MNACLSTELTASPGGLLAVAISLGVLGLAAWLARRHAFPGRTPFWWLQCAALAWLITKGIELSVMAPACKMFWSANAWPAILSTSTLWAVFLWRYTHPAAEPLRSATLTWLAAAPLAMWIAASTNPWHGLVYLPGSRPIGPEPGAPIRYLHGPVFWLAAAYAYVLMVAGVVFAARAAIGSQGALRRLHFGLLGATLVPWLANLSYVAFGVRVFGVDPTPFSFVLVLLLLAWAIQHWHLFDLKPIARSMLLDALPDPVLVLDQSGRVVEVNPAARRLSGAQATGQPLAQWPLVGTALARAIERGTTGQDLPLDGRVFELQRVALGDASHAIGTLVYLRDVTQRHHSEARLAQALVERDEQVRTVTRLHEAMQEQALRDPLTGLHNRRALETFFERALQHAERGAQTVSVALIDLDRFKRINDTHGHAVGDEVLTALARRLTELTRASDGLFRFGGEEFLLVLPGAGLQAACGLAAALCEAVRARPVPTAVGPLACTMSVGVAEWGRHGDTLHELLRAADAALYRAKAGGRDRVEAAGVTGGMVPGTTVAETPEAKGRAQFEVTRGTRNATAASAGS